MSEFESVRLLIFIGVGLLASFAAGKYTGHEDGYHEGYDDGRQSVINK